MPRSSAISRRDAVGAMFSATVALALPDMGRADQDNAFKFGLTPVFLVNDLELLDHLKKYLEMRLGGPVELITRRTYQEITALLVSGQLHSAWICGYPYVQFEGQLDLVATPSWHGKPLYRSYIIVPRDRQVEDWKGLRGDVHAFSDPDSNSGYLVTTALLAESRLTPSRFFSHHFFTYGHRNVVRAVAAGLAQSGSVDGYVWDVMRETEPDLVAQTKVLRRSEWLGFPPVASPRMLAGEPRLATFQQALTSMKNDPEGRKVLDLLRLDGFVVTQSALFDTIAAKMNLVRQFG
ncbi:MAG: PhnD/SsuA/transferrin family substrate-binding protein [Rhizobiales bacterium]|nr:PhnD/SsuA/transferrin family substrate-binding protein [Hyphomicrobiales bacterium]